MARTKFYKANNMTEIGSTGLQQYGGWVYEDGLKLLTGLRGIKIFKEMADNDATIGGILFAIDKLLRSVKWRIESFSEDPADKANAEFVDSCRNDMEHSWGEMVSEILSMLTYGFAPLEIVYKLRGGLDNKNPKTYSKFNDGKIGWRKLPIRGQDTLWAWKFDDFNNVLAMEQILPYGGKNPVTPIEKLLLFRTDIRKNNPQGKSILRNAYRSWFFKKRIEEIEGIGIERDLAGLPVAHVPPQILAVDATAAEKAQLASIKRMITNIRRDQQEGVVFPLMYDENGKEMYKLELLSTGGTRQFDTSKIIDRYDKRIATTVLADFLFLGQSRVGSFALSTDKTDLFTLALTAWLESIADVFNRKGIPDLMEVNGLPVDRCPKIVPGDIEKEDISVFVDAVYKLVGVGALIPDESLDTKIRELLNLSLIGTNGRSTENIDTVMQRFLDMKNKSNQQVNNNDKKGTGSTSQENT